MSYLAARVGLSVLMMGVLLSVPASTARAGDGWRWSITPYLWASDVSETLIVDGQVVGGEDTEFKDLVDKLDSSLQLHFEGIGDRWGLFADVSYIDLRDSKTGEMGVARLDAKIEETNLEGGMIYRPGGRSGRFELLFGARSLAVDERYRLRLGELEPVESRIDEDYLDAMVAARLKVPLSDRWAISLRGDYSTGGTDYIWTAQGLLGWQFGKRRNSAVFVGYRYRELKYTKADVIEVRKTISGFGAGLKIGF